MIARDAAFHSAIRAGNEQCILIRMPDTSTFLTNEDVAEGGLSFTESVNPETNLTMGRAVQSEISLELLNDGLLQNIDFDGEIDVRLGVKTDDRVEDVDVPAGAMLMCVSGSSKVIAAHTNWDHLVIDAENYDLPDDLRAYLLMMVGDELYVIGKDGAMIARYSVTANAVNELPTFATSTFMQGKLARLAEKCVCYRISEYERFDYRVRNGRLYTIEWQTCPLGKFTASKPDKVRSSVISLSAYDGMSKFEVEATPFFDTLSFPITMWDMLTALCAYCGVEMGAVSLINGSKTFDEVPVYDDGMTCRDVLAWIAEANCTFARMDRYGNLDMHWYEDEDYVLMRDDIYDLVEAEYTVKQIEKLQVHCTEEDIGVIIPANDATKKNYYEIMDNPMLYGNTDGDIRPWAQPIYEQLIAFESYCPTYIEAESDWTVQAGDIIAFEMEDGSSKRFPLMNQTITWKGGTAKTQMDCTGEKTRGQMTAKQREKLANGRTIHEFRVTLEEFRSKIENIDVDTISTYAQPEAPPTAREGDLWIDTNDNNRMYRYDGSKWVDCSDSSVTVKTYAQNTAPSSANAGDLWINTADSNKLYRYNGTSWVAYASDAGIDTYAQTSAPASGVKTGDLWIDTDDNNTMYRWSGSTWVKVQDTHLDKLVESHSTQIEQNSKAIALKADSSIVTELATRMSQAEQKITADAIVSTVRVSSDYTNDLSGKVGKGEVVSCINQTAETIKIQASKIALEGIITANGNVKIDSAGNITCNNGTFMNGTFSGVLTTGNWTFNSEGSKYKNGSIGVNMTVLTGGGFVGGGSNTRAFYGSSGCDTQYGSDYDYQCIIRGGKVGIYTGDGTGVMVEHVGGAEDPSFYCVGAGSSWTDAVGNLGGASHRWDVGYIRSFNQSSSKYVKHDIADMPDMGKIIDALRPVTFVYNGDKDEQTQYGLIYEEAIEVFDHICLRPKTDDVNEIGIDYTKLITVLLEGIKGLRRRVAVLEQ